MTRPRTRHLLAVLTLLVALLAGAGSASAASVTPFVPTNGQGPITNPECADIGMTAAAGYFEDHKSGGDVNPGSHPAGNTGNPITYVISATKQSLNWNSTTPVDAVIVKGAEPGNAYVYPAGTLGDTGLQPPPKNGHIPDISNVKFCWKPRAKITIIKNAVPDSSTAFPFTATSPQGGTAIPGFSLDDDAATLLPNTKLIWATPGQYSVTEGNTSGWELTALSCTDQLLTGQASTGDVVTKTATIRLDSIQDEVTCTFKNEPVVPTTQIRILKDTLPAGSQNPFDFTAASHPDGGFTQTDAGAAVVWNVQAGTYPVTEAVEPGWKLTGISCSDSDSTEGPAAVDARTTQINVTAGEGPITCTFTNTQNGSITVEKETDPDGSGPFGFSLTGPGTNKQFSLSDEQSEPTAVAPGTYTVDEVIPDDWDLASISCSGETGGNTATGTISVTVSPNENVTCLYTNEEEEGSIRVVKEADPADGTLFDFTLDGPGVDKAFDLSDGQGEPTPGVSPGTYTIDEDIPEGWLLKSVSCTGGATTNLATGTTTVVVSPGEDVICTYFNEEQGALTVVKQTAPAETGENATAFPFAVTEGGAAVDSYSLRHNQADSSDVDAGTYRVTETQQPGYRLTSISCTDGSQPDLANGRVDVAIANGENVTCTFTNTKDGSITVVKQTSPAETGDGATPFSFSLSTNDGPAIDTFQLRHAQSDTTPVAPGDYDVVETAADGYTLQSITCSDGSTGSTATGKADVNVAPGENVTCTYVNARNETPAPAPEQQRVQAASIQQPQPQPVRVTAPSRRIAGQARLQGPSGCVTRPFTVRIRGRQIQSVAFFVGDRRVRTLRGARSEAQETLTYRIAASTLRSGRVSRVTARVTFTTASGTRSRSLRIAVQRCRAAVAPKFTG